MKLRAVHIPLLFIAACIFFPGDSTSVSEPSGAATRVSPFHDVFYKYYGGERNRALARIQHLQKDTAYRRHALINHGVIFMNEKRSDDAVSYYTTSLKEYEPLALSYLYDLYRRTDPARAFTLLQSAAPGSGSPWAYYEISLACCQRNDSEGALQYLEAARTHGFDSKALLMSEPGFNALRPLPRFQKIVASLSNAPGKTLIAIRDEMDFLSVKDAASGIPPRLRRIAVMEKNREYAPAMDIVNGLLKTELPLRDRCYVLYRAARISELSGDSRAAEIYCAEFIRRLTSEEKDPTGFKDAAAPVYRDIIAGDPVLKKYASP